MYSVTKLLSGKYRAYVMYRDDSDTKDFDTEAQAVAFIRDCAIWNGKESLPRHGIEFFDEQEVVRTERVRVPRKRMPGPY